MMRVRPLAGAVGVGEGGDERQPPGDRLDLGPHRPPAVQSSADDVHDGPLVAGRVAGVDGNQGRGQIHHFVDVHVVTHPGEPTDAPAA